MFRAGKEILTSILKIPSHCRHCRDKVVVHSLIVAFDQSYPHGDTIAQLLDSMCYRTEIERVQCLQRDDGFRQCPCHRKILFFGACLAISEEQ